MQGRWFRFGRPRQETMKKILAVIWLASAVLGSAQVSISSVSPNYGIPGDPNYIIISGSGFSLGQLNVSYNGVRDFSAQATSDTQIFSTVPPGATTGRISVRVNNGTPAYSEVFMVGPKPYVSGFSPISGSDNTVVTVNGAFFIGSSVYFGSRAARDLKITAADGTVLECRPPVGVTNGPITVVNSYGNFTTTSNFYAPPVISGFTPTSGRAGTNVTLSGTNFLGASYVYFPGTNGDMAVLPRVSNNRALEVTVPAGARTGLLRIETPGGPYDFTNYVFKVAPVITGFSPTFGGAGTNVTILGANFGGTGQTNVTFNGTPATIVGPAQFGSITARVPAGATTGPIIVTTADGNHTSAGIFYVPPRIDSITPNYGEPGDRVELNGVNFMGTTTVLFDGLVTTFFLPTNNTKLVVTVPAGVHTGPVTVGTLGGTNTSQTLFYAAPVITSFSPASGLPGTQVTLSGQNLLGATNVFFNGQPADFVPPTENGTIIATVPAGVQTGDISVLTPGGAYTNPQPFVLDYRSDVLVTLSGGAPVSTIGDELTYHLQIRNSGPHVATNVFLTNYFGTLLQFEAFDRAVSNFVSGPNVVVVFKSMTAGATEFLDVYGKAVHHGTATATFEVTSSYVDPQPGNNKVEATTIIYPVPYLTVSRYAPKVIQVAWPVMLTNHTLQAAGIPTAPNVDWTNVTSPVSIIGDFRVVTEPATAPLKFYRLKP